MELIAARLTSPVKVLVTVLRPTEPWTSHVSGVEGIWPRAPPSACQLSVSDRTLRLPNADSNLVTINGPVTGFTDDASKVCNPALPVTNGLSSGTTRGTEGLLDPGPLIDSVLVCE